MLLIDVNCAYELNGLNDVNVGGVQPKKVLPEATAHHLVYSGQAGFVNLGT